MALWVFRIMEFLAQTLLSLLPGPVWISSLGERERERERERESERERHTHPHSAYKPGRGGEACRQQASGRSWGRLPRTLDVPKFKNSNFGTWPLGSF